MNPDLVLQQRVVDELKFELGAHAERIEVSLHAGVVVLGGRLDSDLKRQLAENAARRVEGVKAVTQQIDVVGPADKKVADEEIAARAEKILLSDPSSASSQVSVVVRHGAVELGGEVDWEFQRRDAERDVRRLHGVKCVVNHIRLRSRALLPVRWPAAAPQAVAEANKDPEPVAAESARISPEQAVARHG